MSAATENELAKFYAPDAMQQQQVLFLNEERTVCVPSDVPSDAFLTGVVVHDLSLIDDGIIPDDLVVCIAADNVEPHQLAAWQTPKGIVLRYAEPCQCGDDDVRLYAKNSAYQCACYKWNQVSLWGLPLWIERKDTQRIMLTRAMTLQARQTFQDQPQLAA